MDKHGGYRLTLAALLGLVLSAITTGVYLEKHVLAATTKPDFAVIAQAWNLIESNYVDRVAIRPERMTHAAIRGLVDSLGDTGHSVYLTKDQVHAEQDALSGHISGIGVVTPAEYAAIEDDIAGLKAFIGLTSPTNAQSVAAIKGLIRVLGAIVRD